MELNTPMIKPHKICVGDLVDSCMNLKGKFYSRRVARIYGNTCCVMFPNNEVRRCFLFRNVHYFY